jgi:hypothetical protein
LAQLDSDIANAQSEAELANLNAQRATLIQELSSAIRARDEYESMLDSKALEIAALYHELNNMPDPCEHENPPTQCSTCGNQPESCSCMNYCSTCSNSTEACTCSPVVLCELCMFDSQFCGCSSFPPMDEQCSVCGNPFDSCSCNPTLCPICIQPVESCICDSTLCSTCMQPSDACWCSAPP